MLTPIRSAVLSGRDHSVETLPAAIITQLKQDAVIVARGFLPTKADFVSLTDTMCRFQAHLSGSFSVGVFGARDGMSADGTVTTVNLGTEEIPLHRERTYTPLPPQVMFFYCQRAPRTPAPTIALDGGAFLARLPDRLRRFAERSAIRYHRRFELTPQFQALICRGLEVDTLDQARQLLPVVAGQLLREDEFTIHEFSDAVLSYEITSPMVRQGGMQERPSFCNSLIPDPTTTFADGTPLAQSPEWRELVALAGQAQYAHRWQRGDLLIIDNTAAMHGRLAHHDDIRQIAVRMGWWA